MAHAHSHAGAGGVLAGVLLPRDARPTRYAVFLAPDLVACTFKGSEKVSIEIDAGRAGLREVVLHANQLHVHDVKFAPRGGGAALVATHISFDLKRQTVTMTFGADLSSGELSLSFSGVLNDELSGF